MLHTFGIICLIVNSIILIDDILPTSAPCTWASNSDKIVFNTKSSKTQVNRLLLDTKDFHNISDELQVMLSTLDTTKSVLDESDHSNQSDLHEIRSYHVRTQSIELLYRSNHPLSVPCWTPDDSSILFAELNVLATDLKSSDDQSTNRKTNIKDEEVAFPCEIRLMESDCTGNTIVLASIKASLNSSQMDEFTRRRIGVSGDGHFIAFPMVSKTHSLAIFNRVDRSIELIENAIFPSWRPNCLQLLVYRHDPSKWNEHLGIDESEDTKSVPNSGWLLYEGFQSKEHSSRKIMPEVLKSFQPGKWVQDGKFLMIGGLFKPYNKRFEAIFQNRSQTPVFEVYINNVTNGNRHILAREIYEPVGNLRCYYDFDWNRRILSVAPQMEGMIPAIDRWEVQEREYLPKLLDFVVDLENENTKSISLSNICHSGANPDHRYMAFRFHLHAEHSCLAIKNLSNLQFEIVPESSDVICRTIKGLIFHLAEIQSEQTGGMNDSALNPVDLNNLIFDCFPIEELMTSSKNFRRVSSMHQRKQVLLSELDRLIDCLEKMEDQRNDLGLPNEMLIHRNIDRALIRLFVSVRLKQWNRSLELIHRLYQWYGELSRPHSRTLILLQIIEAACHIQLDQIDRAIERLTDIQQLKIKIQSKNKVTPKSDDQLLDVDFDLYDRYLQALYQNVTRKWFEQFPYRYE